MAKGIRAKFANGVLTPLEKLDLEEGAEVTLSVDAESSLNRASRVSCDSSGSVAGIEGRRPNSQEFLQSGGRKQDTAPLSVREWLKEVRKRKEASPTQVTAAQILESRDADRR